MSACSDALLAKSELADQAEYPAWSSSVPTLGWRALDAWSKSKDISRQGAIPRYGRSREAAAEQAQEIEARDAG